MLRISEHVAANFATCCRGFRDMLRRKNIDVRLKKVLQSMQVATRNVEGSEAERDVLRFKFGFEELCKGKCA